MHDPTPTIWSDDVQKLVELMRPQADRCCGNGAEVWAIGYLSRHVHATTEVELREAGEALRDMLTALAVVRDDWRGRQCEARERNGVRCRWPRPCPDHDRI